MVLVDPAHALGAAEGVDGADPHRLGRVGGAGGEREQRQDEQEGEGAQQAHRLGHRQEVGYGVGDGRDRPAAGSVPLPGQQKRGPQVDGHRRHPVRGRWTRANTTALPATAPTTNRSSRSYSTRRNNASSATAATSASPPATTPTRRSATGPHHDRPDHPGQPDPQHHHHPSGALAPRSPPVVPTANAAAPSTR